MNLSPFDTEKSTDIFMIDILVLVVVILLAGLLILFYFQCIHRVESINIDCDSHIRVTIFNGRNITFNIDNIKSITPFESKKDNCRMGINDGSYLYTSEERG